MEHGPHFTDDESEAQGREGNCLSSTAGELQDLKEAAFLNLCDFSNWKSLSLVLKGFFLWVYQPYVFEKRHYTKLIPDPLSHLGLGILSSPSPSLSSLSVSNATSSVMSILMPSNKMSPLSLNGAACGPLEALLNCGITWHLL